LQNALSNRTTRCLVNAGVAVNKRAIVHALRSGQLFPYYWPPNYGRLTHVEVCRWAGIDPKALPTAPSPRSDFGLDLTNGLFYRANRCLARSGIAATKEAVCHALQAGVLSPGKRPSNYGRQTHAELCRWADIDPVTLACVDR
jgi:hypothetical protein